MQTNPNVALTAWLRRWFPLLAVAGVVVNGLGLLNEVMEPDGALYASIARRMALHNDCINLIGDGGDWLDKPHFPFWITALSFKCFGINAFAYKLPAFLCWAMGAYYTWLFARTVYGSAVAQLAVLLYMYALHLLLSNFDVRAEPYLTGLIIGAVYHFYRLSQKTSWKHLLAGALYCACAVMTKGIFVGITVGSGLVVQWVVLRDWRQFIRWVWWVGVLLVLLFITPELYALYEQFDRHPEKLVFGHKGVSGIRFFFWDSQFGRFFNTGPIRGSGDPFFYLHTLLWAFLPWAFLLYTSLYWSIQRAVRARQALPEYLSLGCGLTTLVMFSLSKFQLPHYLNIVFPFYAIITAYYLSNTSAFTLKRLALVQDVVGVLVLVAVLAIALVYRPPLLWLCLLLIVLLACAGLLLFTGKGFGQVVGRSCWVMAILAVFLNLFFFPSVLHYQSGMAAGRWLKERDYRLPLVMTGCHSYSLEFYAPAEAGLCSPAQLGVLAGEKGRVLVFTPLDSVGVLRKQWSVEVVQTFPHFPVSRLDMGFVYAATRSSRLRMQVLAIVTRLGAVP